MSYLGDLPGLRWDPVSGRYFSQTSSPSIPQHSPIRHDEQAAVTDVQSLPVDPSVLRTLRRRRGAGECGICGDIIKGSNILLPCRHTFHAMCATEWFRRKGSCPQCRSPVDTALAAAATAAANTG